MYRYASERLKAVGAHSFSSLNWSFVVLVDNSIPVKQDTNLSPFSLAKITLTTTCISLFNRQLLFPHSSSVCNTTYITLPFVFQIQWYTKFHRLYTIHIALPVTLFVYYTVSEQNSFRYTHRSNRSFSYVLINILLSSWLEIIFFIFNNTSYYTIHANERSLYSCTG